MPKKNERNTKVTAESVEVSRNDVINDVKDWLRTNAKGISGNAQKNIIDAVVIALGNDKKNADWASVEQDTYHKTWDQLADLWSNENEEFVGLTSRAYELVSSLFDDVVVDRLWKTNKDLEVLGYERKNAYNCVVSCTSKGSPFKVLIRSITGKANGAQIAFLPLKLWVSKAHDSDHVRSAFADVKGALEEFTAPTV